MLNACYINGVFLFKDKEIRGDCQLAPENQSAPNTRIVVLRFAAPAKEAEMIEKAFHSGIVEVNVEGVQTLLSGNQTV